MKISNETKIGALTAIAIALLYFGFNFLKGKSVMNNKAKIYAVFKNVSGLEVSNSVRISGLDIGTVYSIAEKDADLSGIVVTINLSKDVHIPKNSLASISSSILGSTAIDISKGDGPQYMASGDTIATEEKANVISKLEKNIDPVLARLGGTLQSLDSVVVQIGKMFDPATKNNFSALMAHLATSSASLQSLLNAQSGALAQSLGHVDSFTQNLARNNDHITHTLDNLDKTTTQLSNAKIEETVSSISSTMDELKKVLQKVNNGSGTLGLLVNDKKLYQNLEGTSRSLNILLDDFRVHPKRYVNISVFGKKDKSGPLTAPLSDSNANAPTNRK